MISGLVFSSLASLVVPFFLVDLFSLVEQNLFYNLASYGSSEELESL